jgi:excisionase family DNA binding protein
MPHDELLTTADVAGMLGKSTRTVQRLAESGELKHAQKIAGGPSGIYLFRPEDVNEYRAAEAKASA